MLVLFLFCFVLFCAYILQVPITRNEIGSCTNENNTSTRSLCQKASANHQLRRHITREKNMLSWKIFVIFLLFHFLLLIQAYCTLAAETPRQSLSCCRLEQNGFFHFEALVTFDTFYYFLPQLEFFSFYVPPLASRRANSLVKQHNDSAIHPMISVLSKFFSLLSIVS